LSVITSLRGTVLVLFVAGLLFSGGQWWLHYAGEANPPAVYVALGASDTVGVGADHPAAEGWAPRVHAGLPLRTRFVNLGISGATLEEITRQELPPALDARPRWVTLWAGVNDIARGVPRERFSRQLDTLLADLRSAAPGGERTILVLNIPDLRQLPAFAGVDPALLDTTVRAWNQAIAEAAVRHDAMVVDLYAHWNELAQHPEYLSADGFHPSSRGYGRIAELVLNTLNQDVSSAVPPLRR
jgi:lysophospholipase L1-like esterase